MRGAAPFCTCRRGDDDDDHSRLHDDVDGRRTSAENLAALQCAHALDRLQCKSRHVLPSLSSGAAYNVAVSQVRRARIVLAEVLADEALTAPVLARLQVRPREHAHRPRVQTVTQLLSTRPPLVGVVEQVGRRALIRGA